MEKFRILALDGGGIRGIISAIWLQCILERLGTPENPAKPADCFDLIVGSSTGAITAATAALGRNLSDAIALYQSSGARIFPPAFRQARRLGPALFRPAYSSLRLGRVLAEHFGEATMSSAQTRLLIPAYRTFDRSIALMRSYTDFQAPSSPEQDGSVWEVCKASCSAPTYFAAHVPRSYTLGQSRAMIDGGMFANNPALLGIAEAVRLLPGKSLLEISKTHDIVVVSLGTGQLLRPLSNAKVQSWGMLGWVRPSIDILMDGSSQISDFCSQQILPDEGYVRMQVELKGANDDLDDASERNVVNLANLAHAHLEKEGKHQLNRIVTMLSPDIPLQPAWRNHM